MLVTNLKGLVRFLIIVMLAMADYGRQVALERAGNVGYSASREQPSSPHTSTRMRVHPASPSEQTNMTLVPLDSRRQEGHSDSIDRHTHDFEVGVGGDDVVVGLLTTSNAADADTVGKLMKDPGNHGVNLEI